MSTERTKKAIEVCDEAFTICIDICQRSLNVERDKLLEICKSLEMYTLIPSAVGIEICHELVKIFLKSVRVEQECTHTYFIHYASLKKRDTMLISILVFLLKMSLTQGCHGTGKTGNLEVHFSRQGKHRDFAKKY